MTRIVARILLLGLVVYLVSLVAQLEHAARMASRVAREAELECAYLRGARGAERQPRWQRPPDPGVQIVDIATASGQPALIARALHLADTVRIVGLNDVRLADGIPTDVAVALMRAEPGRYYDIALRDQASLDERRLLVLFH